MKCCAPAAWLRGNIARAIARFFVWLRGMRVAFVGLFVHSWPSENVSIFRRYYHNNIVIMLVWILYGCCGSREWQCLLISVLLKFVWTSKQYSQRTRINSNTNVFKSCINHQPGAPGTGGVLTIEFEWNSRNFFRHLRSRVSRLLLSGFFVFTLHASSRYTRLFHTKRPEAEQTDELALLPLVSILQHSIIYSRNSHALCVLNHFAPNPECDIDFYHYHTKHQTAPTICAVVQWPASKPRYGRMCWALHARHSAKLTNAIADSLTPTHRT